jgi:hypothetical protein
MRRACASITEGKGQSSDTNPSIYLRIDLLLEGDTGTTVDGKAVILTVHLRVLNSDRTIA